MTIDPMHHELSRLLDAAYAPLESGFRRLDSGVMMVAALHRLHGVKGRMVGWWLGRQFSPEEFHRWHPADHVSWSWDARRGAAIVEHRVEGGIQRLKIQRRDAAAYFDPEHLAAAGVSAAICSRGGPAEGDGWASHVVHVCRDTDDGCEMRSRFFLGDFDPPLPTPGPAQAKVGSAAAARAILRHTLEEYAHLARFLPEAYARHA